MFPATSGATMAQPSEIDDILALEGDRCKATAEGDLDALKNILADDYVHVTGNGAIMNKLGYLSWVKELPRSHQRTNLNVRLYGDTAVIYGDLLNRLQTRGGETVIETVVTQVAHRSDGKWRFVSFHITPKHSPQY